jgi:hypothetical protein
LPLAFTAQEGDSSAIPGVKSPLIDYPNLLCLLLSLLQVGFYFLIGA